MSEHDPFMATGEERAQLAQIGVAESVSALAILRIGRLTQRISNLEGSSRTQRENLDKLEKQRDGDRAEFDALKRAPAVERNNESVENDLRDELVKAANDRDEARFALRRACDTLGVLPSVGASDLPAMLSDLVLSQSAVDSRMKISAERYSMLEKISRALGLLGASHDVLLGAVENKMQELARVRDDRDRLQGVINEMHLSVRRALGLRE